jgi:hypothetical protein
MRTHLGVAGIDHQPLIVRLIDGHLQQRFPQVFIAPAAKAPMDVFSATIVGRQVTPGSAGTQYPEDGVDEALIVLGDTVPGTLASGQVRFEQNPGAIVDIVAAMHRQFFGGFAVWRTHGSSIYCSIHQSRDGAI